MAQKINIWHERQKLKQYDNKYEAMANAESWKWKLKRKEKKNLVKIHGSFVNKTLAIFQPLIWQLFALFMFINCHLYDFYLASWLQLKGEVENTNYLWNKFTQIWFTLWSSKR